MKWRLALIMGYMAIIFCVLIGIFYAVRP